MAEYNAYESIYGGADNFFMPKFYESVGYQTPISELGMSTDPRTANQLGEINLKVNVGTKHMEVGGIQGAVFESIPEQHLDEIRRVAKLAGVKPSVHAPIVEASGIGERGWDETNRLGAEKQLESALLRSHKLDPNGNISVTTHTSALPEELTSKIKTKDGEEIKAMWIINPETGRVTAIHEQARYFPEEGEFKETPPKFEPEKELEKINRDQWTEQVSGINRYAEFGEDSIERIKSGLATAMPSISREDMPERKKLAENIIQSITSGMAGEIDLEKIKKQGPEYEELIESARRGISHGQIYLRDAYRNMRNLFDMAYANAEGKDKEDLKTFANWAASKIRDAKEKGNFENDPRNVNVLGDVVERGLKTLGDVKKTPEMWKPLQKFATEKAAETFANVAESAYNKFGDTAPMLNIENPPAGGALSRGEDLKKVIDESRKKLAENLSNKGMSSSQARKVAEKMIGATWDVGHINMMRKRGYSEKDVIKETEKIAPYVKHVHLSDNFGLDHTELPMGMGNVPLKEMMKRLGEKGFEGQKIIEAGNWWQYFAEHGGGNPFKPSIEAFDSPLYTMRAGPVWSQAGAYGSYFSGHGPVNPPIHHRTYGAGFEALPQELGGQIPGDQSRFAGTPNQ